MLPRCKSSDWQSGSEYAAKLIFGPDYMRKARPPTQDKFFCRDLGIQKTFKIRDYDYILTGSAQEAEIPPIHKRRAG